MPRLVYRARARRELAGIAAYITRESGDRRVAESFVAKLTEHCEHLANLPGFWAVHVRSSAGTIGA